ncbi:MAG TPA: 1-(5-phosphoribosyl)-5-[(5-phosphoribosylamino)methylideneamino]imidazole-4-carboxamide isomerase [Saprospiraceae bacterium]|nr:1-(5-phosphoribosyl)-5-[(5-phosphoribosylamino)methylideneamino]imidazole-4-carboxamide isomerase [Saprospiraceae bacterium]HMQ83677.1 1-(5-phosphoribosyl)-5-[(5-phosphoribosylamino)methylideneamino]imidazole-4-carboxamide isomerase [Saprospiraceae bacterium]
MHIIPAIDLIEGKCVRLTQGDFSQKKIYNEDPLEVALQFEAHGIQRLHLVDLDGARSGHIVNHAVLEQIATQTGLWIDFGGGLQSDEDVRIAFESGASQITGGTIAVKNEALFLSWVERYGAESIILGADVKEGKIAVSGWKEQSDMELMPFLSYFHEKGLQYAISTDVSKDGLLQGSALELYRKIREQLPELALIASGGVSTLDELDQLNDIGCFGVIIGKAIYEGKIRLVDLDPYL